MAEAPPRSEFERRERLARIYLIWLSAMILLAACTATGTYSYPETLGEYQGVMIVMHDVVGDIAIAISLLYLWNHLKKTWKMRRATVSRWTGIVLVGIWAVTAVTGVIGHVIKLEDWGVLWSLHFVTSIGIIILACFHGAWAYRPRKRPATESA